MNATVELTLSLILFLPWFLVISALFWLFPRKPRPAWRNGFNLVAVLVATALSYYAMRWGFLNADPDAGAIWKQVLACLAAYGAFLAVIGVAFVVRKLLLGKAAP